MTPWNYTGRLCQGNKTYRQPGIQYGVDIGLRRITEIHVYIDSTC